ncbi:MAG: barstar family protein [Clostridia bacterium]|nr:barstar family protein [Clostridia bacterium]
MKNTVILDLTDVGNLEDLHNRIKKALDFPDYYGKNWNAFWDCLNRDCDVDFVKITGYRTISKSLLPHIEKMKELLNKNRSYWQNSNVPFDFEIVN